jgi:hypothetical protein
MERWFTTAKLVVLSLFLAVTAGMVGYQMLYVWPAQRCEKQGAWWDQRDRECLTPIPIKRFTSGAFAAFRPMSALPAPPKQPGHP